MKNICFMALLVSALLVACNHGEKPAENMEKMKTTGPQGVKMSVTQLASNKDYSCGMTLTDDAIGDTTTYNGKIYGFCSSECKAEFLKNPEAALNKK
jgi:YHS domain-containing protein